MQLSIVHHALISGGGMERYLGDLANGLVAAGDEVTVAAQVIDADLARALGVRTVELPVPGHLPRIVAKVVFARRAERWVRAQVAAGIAVITLARVGGATMAVSGGTHRGHLARRVRPGDLGDWLELRREQRTYATARLVLAHSELLKRELLERYALPAGKVTVLYPPVDTSRFRPTTSGQRAEWRVKFGLDDRKQLLFPSGSHRRKGLDLLLAAVAVLPRDEYAVVVAGAKPPRGMPDFVRYVGQVQAMEELYAACDATVMPSRYEPFGLVYAESMLCGTPAVLPSTAGAAEIFGQGIAGSVVLPSLEPAAIAAGIQAALEAGRVANTSFVDRHGLSASAHVRALRDLLVNARAGH